VARTLSLDTSFLVDLERKRRSGSGAAHRFLQADPGAQLCLSAAALGELAEGYGDPDHPVLTAFRRGQAIRRHARRWAWWYRSAASRATPS